MINNTIFSDKYTALIKPSVYRSKALYQSIQLQLKEHMSTDSFKQLSAITDPDYLAVATALVAYVETESARQQLLAASAKQQLFSIKENEKLALATSKVARYFYRQGNNSKESSALFDKALDLANSIRHTKQKDAVLILLATDMSRVFLMESTNKIVNMISNKSLKSNALEILEKAENVSFLAKD